MGRLVLVHGSVTNGAMTWGAQRPLAERWELVVLDRPGFAPGPPVERVDFETDARWLARLLQPGDHLCGHSYGGVVSLLAAERRARGLPQAERRCSSTGSCRRPRRKRRGFVDLTISST